MDIEAEKIKPYEGDQRQKGEQVQEMFDNIAPAYDFMNRAMTMGIDTLWRKRAVKMISAHNQEQKGESYKILDVATGTGDLAIMMAKAMPNAVITGADLSAGMMEIGKEKVAKAGLSSRISFEQADCLSLPVDDNSFDCVSVAYGVRNFQHLEAGYKEMLRVLKPGGMLCVIELAVPVSPIVKPLYRLYTNHIIPLVGRMVSKDVNAYSYLPASIEAVPQREQMTNLIASSGFSKAEFKPLTFGVCVIYTGIK